MGFFFLFCSPDYRGFHGLKDLEIAGAPAEISGKRFADLVAVRVRIRVEQRFRRYQNSRGAIAALRCAEVRKGVLQGVEPPIGGEPLDRQDGSSRAFEPKNQAGEHGLAVQNHGAGAAFSELATVFRSGMAEILTQDFQQRFVRGERDVEFFAIQREPDLRRLL